MKIAIPRSSKVELRVIPGKGRGVVATDLIREETVIEVAPVIRLTEEEETALNDTPLESYVFVWDEPGYPFAIVMGITSLVNHSRRANVALDMDYPSQTMTLTAIRDIAPDEELVFDYDCDLWFEEHP